MQKLKTLPLALKIAIPAAFALLVIVAIMMIPGGAGPVTIATTADPNQKDAYVWKLKEDKITPMIELDGKRIYHIDVPATKEAEARSSITGDNLGSQLEQNTTSECTEPGQLASSSQQERFDRCTYQHDITDLVMRTTGVMQASTTVVMEDSGDLMGSGKNSRVTVKVFLDPDAESVMNAAAVAEQIANMVPGGSVDRVFIADAAGNPLWSPAGSAAGSGAGGAGNACSSPADQIVDITTKERQVADCFEQQISQEIARFVGSTDHVVVSVGVSLNPSAESESVTKITAGAKVQESSTTNSADGSSSTNKDATVEPNKTNTQIETLAGYIKNMKVAVTLDSRYVTPELAKTVKSQLQAYVDVSRGDPQPTVESVKFGGIQAPASTSTGDGATGGPAATTKREQPRDVTVVSTSTNLPMWMIIMMVLVVAGFSATIALLLRRSKRDSAERQRLEAEFEQDKFAFQGFAQENVDDLASELTALLGAPTQPRDPSLN